MAARFAAPFYWVDNDTHMVISNGSTCFWDTGKMLLAITANHVFEGYLASNNTTCFIGNLQFDPNKRLIDRCANADLAVMEITTEEISRVAPDSPKFIVSGEPKIPEVGRGILMAGFPGSERIAKQGECSFGLFSATVIATSINDRYITYQIDRENSVGLLGAGVPSKGFNFGGASGGPVLTLIESKNGIVTWRMGGIIGEGQENLELVLCPRADLIKADGNIILGIIFIITNSYVDIFSKLTFLQTFSLYALLFISIYYFYFKS
jgi:hypothetical protein